MKRFAFLLVCLAACPAFAQVRLMSATKEANLRSVLPAVEPEKWQAVLENPRLIFYTIAEMPAVYMLGNGNQAGAGGTMGFHDVRYNVSGDPPDNGLPHGQGGNLRVSFPWRFDTPGGTQRAVNVGSFKFLLLPERDGRVLPVVYFASNYVDPLAPGGRSRGPRWLFPTGTVFGEILTQRHGGVDYCFEVRLRERIYGDWETDVLRPCPTAEALADLIRKLRPDFHRFPRLQKLIEHLRDESTLRKMRLVDDHPTRKAFDVTAGVDSLPDIGDDELVAEILSQPFKSAMGAAWKQRGPLIANAASYEGDGFHIVPRAYDGTFVGNDQAGCKLCHDTGMKAARTFDRDRGWYGVSNGSDGIMSWMPAAREAISRNGATIPIRWRKEFVDAGLFEPFDSSKHDQKTWHQIREFMD